MKQGYCGNCEVNWDHMNHKKMTKAPSGLLQALLYPKSVALIGASDDPAKTGGRPLQYLRKAGFTGNIFPINPQREYVQGERAWRSVHDLPVVPDHAFILTPSDAVTAAVQACADAGVKVVTILASGFSETGAEGVEKESRLREIAQSTGLRMIGPSSLGIINMHTGLMLTANAAFAEPDMPKGRVFVASHSGSMLGALLSRGKARGMGFSGLVSVGSEVDLSIGEICAATLDDPETQGYLLFLESLGDGKALRQFAVQAAQRRKPVFAYKLGRTDVGAELAATHTGALAGEDDVADAFFRGVGIMRVEMLDTLLEIFPLVKKLNATRTARARRIGVVTTTGGGAAMLVDQLGTRGVVVEAPSEHTRRRLREAEIPGSSERIVDLTLAGTRYDVMHKTLNIMLNAPEFDMVVAVIGSSARFHPDLAVMPIVDSSAHDKPLLAMVVPDAPDALSLLVQADIPGFRSPESCADAIAAALAYRLPTLDYLSFEQPSSSGLTLSEADGYEILQRLGVSHAPFVLGHLTNPPTRLPFSFPVVAKLCSADLPHKTDVGGVILNIQNFSELNQACEVLKQNLSTHAPHICDEQVMIQSQREGVAEVLLGYRVDPQAGPIVMLAGGGIWTEVIGDRSIRLAPVTEEIAKEMIAEVKMLKTITGLRGKEKGDIEALVQAIVKLSSLAVRDDLSIQELEINPLLVMSEGNGVQAVDALVVAERGCAGR